MSTTFACIKGKMGSTEFYVLKMKAGILINTIGYASQIPEWDDMDIDERMQRELDEKRVVTEIVPYLINDPDKFFGSMIIDVYKGWEELYYEQLHEMVKGVPKAYQNQLEDFGFITLPDNQSLIALDGQHRLLALNVAIKGYRGLTGSTKLTEEMKTKLKPNPEILEEDITIILVPHTDNVKIRKIFNKVNRYAKSTSRGDNIITDEDDIYAIIARRLMKSGEPLAPINNQDLVNWTSNTLSKRSKQLTTISATYSITEEIIGRYDKKTRPSNDLINEKYDEIADFWRTLLEGLDDYCTYIEIIDGNNSSDVSSLREKSLLLKPVTQMAIAIGYTIAKKKGIGIINFVEMLNKINWNFDNEMWQQILVMNGTGKVLTNKQAVSNAGRLIGYLVAGYKYNTNERDELLKSLRLVKPNATLPEPKQLKLVKS